MIKKNGFSLIELLVVLTIVIILTIISLVKYRDLQKQTLLEIGSQNILATLKNAQTQTLASRDLSSFGVHFENQSYTLFKGETYSAGDPNNEIHQMADDLEIYEINIESGSNVFFEKVSGLPIPAGPSIIRLRVASDTSKTKSIKIEPSGVIMLEGSMFCCAGNRISDTRHIHFQLGWSIQNSAAATLNFTDTPPIVVDIQMADYFDALKTEFSWSGAVNVNGQSQELKIHTHQLDASDTTLCVHRDRSKNNKPLQILIDNKDIVSYTAAGSASIGTFGGIMNVQ